MKAFKRILALLLTVVMLLPFVLVNATEIVNRGQCGDSVQWVLDTKGLLTISGTGSMVLGNQADWRRYSGDIKECVIKDGVTNIHGGAFYGCQALTIITIPNSVTSIGDSAFAECTGLTGITIPNSVTSIGGAAFIGCSSLTEITIPNSVTSIGADAFNDCENLKKLKFGTGVMHVGKSAFKACPKLKRVDISDVVAWYSSMFDDFFANPIYTAHEAYLNGVLLTDLEISQSVKSIGGFVFAGCESLTRVVIPDNITSIGNGAFYGCSNLSDLVIGNGVTGIERETFAGCTSLTYLTVGNHVEYIYYGFCGCTSLVYVEIPDSVKAIGDFAFTDCKELKSISIGIGIESVDYKAFSGCGKLTDVYYSGTESQWNDIVIQNYQNYNLALIRATKHFSVKEQDQTSEDEKNCFYEKKYIADLWLGNSISDTQKYESDMVNRMLGYTSMTDSLLYEAEKDKNGKDKYTPLMQNKTFKNSVALWKGMSAGFNPAGAVKDATFGYIELYEKLIFDLLKKVMEEDQAPNVLLQATNALGKATDAVTPYAGFAKDLLSGISSTAETLGDLEAMSKGDVDLIRLANLGALSDVSENLSNKSLLSDLNLFLKEAKSVVDFFKMVQNYQMVVEMSCEMQAFLTAMRDASPNPSYLRDALNIVLKAVGSTEWASLITTKRFAENQVFNIAEKMIDFVFESNPVTFAWKAVYDIGTAAINVLINTDGVIDAFYGCLAANEFLKTSKTAINTLGAKYLSSHSEEDAGAYVYAMRNYQHVYMLDFEAALDFVKEASEEGLVNRATKCIDGLWNWIVGEQSESTYDHYLRNRDTIAKSLSGTVDWILNAWRYNPDYLKKDYPSVYPIYIKKAFHDEAYTPTILWAKLNERGESEITFTTNDVIWDSDIGDYRTLYATMAFEGASITESIAGKGFEKRIEYVGGRETVTMDTPEQFSVFPKTYTVKAFTNAEGGPI